MFNYYNPSKIIFETGILKNKNKLKEVIGNGDYCIFTYSDKVFQEYTNQIIDALGKPKLMLLKLKRKKLQWQKKLQR